MNCDKMFFGLKVDISSLGCVERLFFSQENYLKILVRQIT